MWIFLSGIIMWFFLFFIKNWTENELNNQNSKKKKSFDKDQESLVLGRKIEEVWNVWSCDLWPQHSAFLKGPTAVSRNLGDFADDPQDYVRSKTITMWDNTDPPHWPALAVLFLFGLGQSWARRRRHDRNQDEGDRWATWFYSPSHRATLEISGLL